MAAPPAKHAQLPIQYACRATKSSTSPGVTRASGWARSCGEAAKADGERYGERKSSGGPRGRTCHHDCPAAASQSTNRYASRSSFPDGSDVGWRKIPALLLICMLRSFRIGEDCGVTAPKSRPARIQIQDVMPQIDCGRYAVKRTVGEQ